MLLRCQAQDEGFGLAACVEAEFGFELIHGG